MTSVMTLRAQMLLCPPESVMAVGGRPLACAQGTGTHSWGSSEAGSAACAFSPLSDISWVPLLLVGFVSCFVKRAEKYHHCGSTDVCLREH